MSDNPFEAPKSTVSDISTNTEVGVLRESPKKNSIGFGWKWIKEGFGFFKQSPLIWILNLIIYFVIFIVLSLLPLVSILTSLLTPLFGAGFIYGAHELDHGRPLKVGHLFEGFRKNTGSLFAVGGLYLLGIIVSIAIAAGVAYATGSFDAFTRVASQASTNPVEQLDILKSLILPGLVYLALILPLAMAIWFAPTLVILHDMGAVEAMKKSFNGCLKNMLPYLWYGIIAFVLVLVGVIPLGLGLLVVLPALTAAMYASYKDIFLD